MKPLPTVFGWSWLGISNFALFQWFCIRLAYRISDNGEKRLWTIIGPYLPLTGWTIPFLSFNYVRLWRKRKK